MKVDKGGRLNNPGFVKGTVFEIDITTKLSQFEGCKLFSKFWVYSFRLSRKTEIDKIFVTPWGIYVIEAKAFNTALVGGFSDTFWSGWTGRKMTKIYNPLFQNFEHCRTINSLARRAGVKPLPLRSYIVVPDGCAIDTIADNVLPLSDFMSMLVSHSCGKKFIKVKEASEFISLLGERK